jgi:hypothetical protein
MCNTFCKFRTHSKDNTSHVVRIIPVWFIIKDKSSKIITREANVLSTDHEMIPARNTSLAAMHGSASGSNVCYYPTRKHSSLK